MRRSLLVWLLWIAVLASCSSDEPTLLEADAGAEQGEDQRIQRMNLQVNTLDATGKSVRTNEMQPIEVMRILTRVCALRMATGKTSLAADETIGQFRNAPSAQCGGFQLATSGISLVPNDGNAPYTAYGTCVQSVCLERVRLCSAELALYLADTVEPLPVQAMAQNDVIDRLSIEPPSAEGKAALAEFASDMTAEVVRSAGSDLITASYDNTFPCAPATIATTRLGTSGPLLTEVMADAMLQGVQTGQDAVDLAVQSYKDVADAEYSRSTDPAAAARLAWVDQTMSRSRAAHLLVGGDRGAGLFGFWGEGMCPIPALSNGAKDAIKVLRESGVSPRFAFDSATTAATLLSGRNGGKESVGARLAERRGDPELSELTPSKLADKLAIKLDDLATAREYLRLEARAFGRDLDLTVPEADPQHPAHSVPDYAATKSRPTPPPSAYYLGLARLPQPHYASEGWELDRREFPQPVVTGALSHTIDFAATVATRLATGTTLRLPDSVVDRMATAASALGEQRTGRLDACYGFDGTLDQYRVRIMGANDASQYEVVRGLSGLRCAVDGHVEGTRCQLSDYTLPLSIAGRSQKAVPSDSIADSGFDHFAEINVATDLVKTPADYLFVVKRRDGALTAPGAYDAIAPLRGERIATKGVSACTIIPIVPSLIDKVGGLLTPNPANCSRPATTCDGAAWNDKIPLENELTADADPVESSWRHYMSQAQEAAEYADRLAEDMITAGERIDERIELAEGDLEKICGGAISIRDLAWQLAGNSRAGACGANNSCPKGFACTQGTCLRDLDATLAQLPEDQRKRLQDCLGNDQIIDIAALGSNDVCLWRPAGDTHFTRTCERPANSAIESPCPYLAFGDPPDCKRPEGLPTGYEVVKVDRKLFLFDHVTVAQQENSISTTSDEALCDHLREARHSGDPGLTVDEFFRFQNVQSYASRVGWRGFPDNHSAITIDGNEMWTTGNPLLSNLDVEGWPCDHKHEHAMDPGEFSDWRKHQLPACSPVSDPAGSLFESYTCSCRGDDDGSRGQRADMNYRMARAVLALRVLSGVGLKGFEGPYIPYVFDLVWEADQDSEACFDSGDTFETCDFEDYSWNMDGQSNVPYYKGYSLASSMGVRYWVHETDDDDDYKTDYIIPGTAYCTNVDQGGNMWWMPDAAEARGLHIKAPCSRSGLVNDGDGPGNMSNHALFFREYSSMLTDSGAPLSSEAWWKLAAGTGGPNDGSAHRAVVWRAIQGAASRTNDVIVNTSDLSHLTHYWDRCNGEEKCNWLDKIDSVGEAYNIAKLATAGFTHRDIADAAELVCEISANDASDSTCGGKAFQPDSMADLGRAKSQLQCIADGIAVNAARALVRNVPVQVEPNKASPQDFEGERGGELAKLVTGYQHLNDLQRQIGHEIAEFAGDVDDLRRGLQKLSVAERQAKLQQLITKWKEASACAEAAAAATGGWFTPKNVTLNAGEQAGKSAAAAFTCANSIAQIALSYEQLNLAEEDVHLDQEQKWADFRRRFLEHHDTLVDLGEKLEDEITGVAGATAAVESQRQAARRALGKGLMFGGDSDGRQYPLNNVFGARYNTLLVRYKEAHRYAIRMAALARRSLEQRLGLDLATMNQDMAFVKAPSTWVDAVCTMRGIDYQEIAAGGLKDGNYANEYIGDYIRRLNQVFESYSVDFNFSDGTDTAVVSLRDDVVHSLGICEVPVNNLLAHAADLTGAGWGVAGCKLLPGPGPACPPPPAPGTPDVDGEPSPNCSQPGIHDCVGVQRLASTVAVSGLDPELGDVPALRVSFGDTTPDSEPDSYKPATPTETDPTLIGQTVSLAQGVYRLSWRGRQTPAADLGTGVEAYDPALAVQAQQKLKDGSYRTLTLRSAHPLTNAGGWPIYYGFFELPDDAEVRIVIVGKRYASAAVAHAHRVDLAAPMLENVTGVVSLRDPNLYEPRNAPPGFVPTTLAGLGMRRVCADENGAAFRTGFTHSCTKLCPKGLGTCSDGPQACYWERALNIALEDLEQGAVLSRAGFALGNYNYRFENAAVNFVGTSLRDCTGTSDGATCFASGNIQYSLYHNGPYRVRNHRGEVYDAPLFTGNIEHARGLAAERYLTNPLSSTDSALVTPYMRRELGGRPLTGELVLRIWDDGSVRFDQLQDIQLLLQYRYWTRNQ